MEKINCVPNWVLVKFDNSNEKLNVGGIEIKIDTTYEPERRAQIKGTVIDFCKKLIFRPEDQSSTLFNVPVELQVGDIVLFHFNSTKIGEQQGRIWSEGEYKYMFIPYDQLFAAIRNNEIIPLNGYVFVEPIKESSESNFLVIPDIAKNIQSKKRGVVKYIGCKVKDYLFYPDQSDDMIDVKVGDEISFKENDAVPLHDSYQAELKNFYRLHRIDVLGVYDRV